MLLFHEPNSQFETLDWYDLNFAFLYKKSRDEFAELCFVFPLM